MNYPKYVLIDVEFQQRVLKELVEIKQLIAQGSLIQSIPEPNELMDTMDLIKYLKIDRRTIYNHRKNGMPFVRKENGKLYYWKSEIDKYFGRNDILINEI